MSREEFYHVFLSFRGETREKFTCFLYEALRNEGFLVFMDTFDIPVGDEVHFTIKEAIKNSMSAIIVFSPNYASSTWCLDELVLILNRLKSSRYFIIPIFYEVEARDIKHQLKNYGTALEKHRLRRGDKVVDKWIRALEEVGNVLGEPVVGLHSTFIRRIVQSYREKMDARFPKWNLREPKSAFMEESSPTPSTSHESSKDEVILYTVESSLDARNRLVTMFLLSGKVVYEERNCSKEPKYLTELEELVGIDKVRFPMVTVNGKDLCGEGVEGLEYFEKKHMLVRVLKIIDGARSIKDIIRRLDGNVKETMQILHMVLEKHRA